ncbi:lipase family protein [Tsukamurella sp. 8F]|uniref:lipase family protein n=1 Tax=unclassified Tsukamurella TaxID=2633480 RepID=UPI0023B8A600|nr:MULTISPECIES: lipase family protein [unclassified Tsukamurella]MDF0530770.1 lipase family protein [Tsukamurella sp. 8J]MDF0587971.1 lipase family protein [Tsukamurella sp. 8F]
MSLASLRQELTDRVTTVVRGLSTPDPIEPVGPPDWSGLDAREYDGEVPAPGSLLTEVPLGESLWIRNAADARRFLYATSNQHGPAVSTAALFLPQSRPPEGGWPVIAWAHGTVGLGDEATPSAQPQSDRQQFYLGHWLDHGYAVVASDYAGLGTPGLMSYLNGKVEAHNLIDSVQAARRIGVPLSSRWALVGQSQGAGAAMNGARYATEFGAGYDLDLRGVVATGTPANIERIVQFLGPSFPPVPLPPATMTYTAYILAALRDARPDLTVDEALSDEGRRIVGLAERLSMYDLREEVRGADVRAWVDRPLRSIEGIFEALKEHMATPVAGYGSPIFLGHGLTDIDVPVASGLSLAASLILHRQPVTVRIYPTDHFGAVYAAAGDAAGFLERAMR